ncbi:MAG: hypothetical protein EBR09_03260 [Proteobacteria bacterium]|nr:hypothetical protein [Pseudomonadota bacterium]
MGPFELRKVTLASEFPELKSTHPAQINEAIIPTMLRCFCNRNSNTDFDLQSTEMKNADSILDCR